jgi:hypothetical protein
MYVDSTIAAVLTGLTFTSGVYRIASAGSVGGTVTLDALGDTSAVFIFKFEGAFTMGAGASILLANGAKVENVFWISEGASSIGASANVTGTLIAHPGAVSMGAGCTLNGRMLSTSGAITLATGTVTIPEDASTIPVECGVVCTNNILGANISNFALFSSAGAIANTGTSGIVGDIGTNAGDVSGWGASIVCGDTHIQNGITQSAKEELDAAYEYLDSLPSVPHIATYGSGETITPGVYSVAAAGSVAGELTLDGPGLYLFKFGGAFSTGAGAKVILENGAQACDVFWLAEGAISMGALTSMRGTTIAHNGANNMGANGAIEGRMLSTAGAVGFYTATAFKDKLFCGASTQPLTTQGPEIVSFSVLKNDIYADISWKMTKDVEIDFYQIEVSTDGSTFTSVDETNSKRLYSQSEYTLKDKAASIGVNYYRLKVTPLDGPTFYSGIQKVNFDINLEDVIVYPNPARDNISIDMIGFTAKAGTIEIFNQLGQQMTQRNYLSIPSEPAVFTLSDFSNGMYIISIKIENQERFTKRFVVNK